MCIQSLKSSFSVSQSSSFVQKQGINLLLKTVPSCQFHNSDWTGLFGKNTLHMSCNLSARVRKNWAEGAHSADSEDCRYSCKLRKSKLKWLRLSAGFSTKTLMGNECKEEGQDCHRSNSLAGQRGKDVLMGKSVGLPVEGYATNAIYAYAMCIWYTTSPTEASTVIWLWRAKCCLNAPEHKPSAHSVWL